MCHDVSQCVYQMYRESLATLNLGGISAASQLALMTARCLGRRDLPNPTKRLLPLLLHTTPTTPTSYYPYYTPKWV